LIFKNMTREEKFNQRGLILYLEIKRPKNILEKINPNLIEEGILVAVKKSSASWVKGLFLVLFAFPSDE
ncbi:22065_t:CDS:2, partial [Gigaspora margarita]